MAKKSKQKKPPTSINPTEEGPKVNTAFRLFESERDRVKSVQRWASRPGRELSYSETHRYIMLHALSVLESMQAHGEAAP